MTSSGNLVPSDRSDCKFVKCHTMWWVTGEIGPLGNIALLKQMLKSALRVVSKRCGQVFLQILK